MYLFSIVSKNRLAGEIQAKMALKEEGQNLEFCPFTP